MKFKKLLSLGIALVLSTSSFAPAYCTSDYIGDFFKDFEFWTPPGHRAPDRHFEVTSDISHYGLQLEARSRLKRELYDSNLCSVLASKAFLPDGRYNEETLKNDLLKLSCTEREKLMKSIKYIFLDMGVADDGRKWLLDYIGSFRNCSTKWHFAGKFMRSFYNLMYRLNIAETVLHMLPKPTTAESQSTRKSQGSIINLTNTREETNGTQITPKPDETTVGDRPAVPLTPPTNPRKGRSGALLPTTDSGRKKYVKNFDLTCTMIPKTGLAFSTDKNVEEIRKQMPGKRILCFCPKDLTGFSHERFQDALSRNGIPYTHKNSSGEIDSKSIIKSSEDTQRPIIYFGENVVFPVNSLRNYEIDCDLIIYGAQFQKSSVCDNHILGKCILYKPDRIVNGAYQQNTFDEGLYVVGDFSGVWPRYAHCYPISPNHIQGGTHYLYGERLLQNRSSNLGLTEEPTFGETLGFAKSSGCTITSLESQSRRTQVTPEPAKTTVGDRPAVPLTPSTNPGKGRRWVRILTTDSGGKQQYVKNFDLTYTMIPKTGLDFSTDKNVEEIRKQMPGKRILCFCPKDLTGFSHERFQDALSRNGIPYAHRNSSGEIDSKSIIRSSEDTQRPIIYFGENVLFSANSLSNYAIDCDLIIYGAQFQRNSVCNNDILGKCILYKPGKMVNETCTKNTFCEGLYVVGDFSDGWSRNPGSCFCPISPNHIQGGTHYLYGKGLLRNRFGNLGLTKEPTFGETLGFVKSSGCTITSLESQSRRTQVTPEPAKTTVGDRPAVPLTPPTNPGQGRSGALLPTTDSGRKKYIKNFDLTCTMIPKTDSDFSTDKNVEEIRKQMPGKRILCFCPKDLTGFSQERFQDALSRNGIPYAHRNRSGEIDSRSIIKSSEDTQRPIIYFGENVLFSENSLSHYEIDCDLIIYGARFRSNSVCDNHILGKCILYKPGKIVSSACIKNTFDEGLYVVGDFSGAWSRNQGSCCFPITPNHIPDGTHYLYGKGLLRNQFGNLGLTKEPTFGETLGFVKLNFARPRALVYFPVWNPNYCAQITPAPTEQVPAHDSALEDIDVTPPPSKRRNVDPGNADDEDERTEYDSEATEPDDSEATEPDDSER